MTTHRSRAEEIVGNQNGHFCNECGECKDKVAMIEAALREAVLEERVRCAAIAKRYENDPELGEFGTCSQQILKGEE